LNKTETLAVPISAFSFQDFSFSLNGQRLHQRPVCGDR